MSILKKAIVILFLSFSAAFGQSNNPFDYIGQSPITHFSPKRYQAHPNNFDVIQDKNGIMYFGNLWCVLQFDGTLWRKIYLPNGASCTSLAIDGDETIYVGGRNSIGYLESDSLGRKKYVSLINDLPDEDRKFNEVWRIVTNEDGIFFTSFEKLFFKKRGQNKLTVLRKTPWYIFKVKEKVYVTANDGLFVFDRERLVKVPNTGFLDGKFINSMTHLGDHLLISTSESGIYLFDGKQHELWNSPINKVLKSFNPTKIQNRNDRHLIIATELNGLVIADTEGNILTHLNTTNGLADNTVSGFLVDDNNLLWLTLYNGISSTSLSADVRFISTNDGISGIPYSSAIYNNRVYLATSEGLFFKSLDNQKSKFQRITSINGLVWNLQVIDNKLFCGQAITAVIIDHDKIDIIFNEGTWDFIPVNENKILMGTYSGLHYLEKINNVWHYKNKLRGYNESSRSFATDKLGDILVSDGNKGVIKLRLDRWKDSVALIKRFTPEQGLPLSNGSTISKFHNEILISTSNGLYHYDFDTEQLKPFNGVNSILQRHGYTHIKKVIADKENKLWIIDNRGSIARISTANKPELEFTTQAFHENLITDFEHINNIGEYAIIGTLDGFALFQPTRQSSLSDTIRTLISRVESSGGIIMDGHFDLKKITVPIRFTENNLRFTFAANSYNDLTSNQYQYFLEGFETASKWSTPSSNPYKEYTNLPEGHYRFHVRAVNLKKPTSIEASLEFTILPPWYKSTWAYILYTAIFILINYAAFLIIKKRIELEKKRIAREEQHNLWLKQKEWDEINLHNQKELVSLQQQKLLAEKAALEQQQLLIETEKEKEKQILAFEKEKLEADLTHKNNELTSLTLHITQKNEMLSKISNEISKTISQIKDDEIAKGLKNIRSTLQKGLNSDIEWEKFTDHFDTVHEGFLKKLKQQYPDLSSSTLKLCAFIKMRLSSKQIATLMNTAPESVLKARYRLRAKFKLEKETGLEEFLNSF